jgi:hypothetical protein
VVITIDSTHNSANGIKGVGKMVSPKLKEES